MSIRTGYNDVDYNELSDPEPENIMDYLNEAKNAMRCSMDDDMPLDRVALATQQAIALALIAMVEKMPPPPRRSILDLKPKVWCVMCERVKKDGEEWTEIDGRPACPTCYQEERARRFNLTIKPHTGGYSFRGNAL